MHTTIPPATAAELAAGILQAAVTLALGALCLYLALRYRRGYFGWWAAAWGLYLTRVVCILFFMQTGHWVWLYWHQVATGLTALTVLWAALVFSRSLRWHRWYALLALFPPIWSYVAIYSMNDFFWAALPMVLFLSFATFWTGWVFVGYRRRVGGSAGATVLAAAFLLWALHHLDYPVLRARGAWSPWGYYVDVVFLLAVGGGILLLVLDELRRGLAALSALSGDLQRTGTGDRLDALLRRPLTLPAVRGSALVLAGDGGAPRILRGAGACAGWSGRIPGSAGAAAIAEALRTGHPLVTNEWAADEAPTAAFSYVAVLPIFAGDRATGALLVAGEARDPFAVLDEDFLVALGRQVGAALDYADLAVQLESRTAELERLSARMVSQHEEERRRLSRELHDETAQVLSAVKMQLGVLRGSLEAASLERLDHAVALVDTGIRSIRNVTNDLRPSLLDDLGLLPALRSLVAEFAERSGARVLFAAPDGLPPLSEEAELALFRALQEALSNVARHAEARTVQVTVSADLDKVGLEVADDGRGLDGIDLARLEREGHMGLTGMRERIGALGGSVAFGAGEPGTRIRIRLPHRDSGATTTKEKH